jgi:membrane protease YdiL (CAAX protease family)
MLAKLYERVYVWRKHKQIVTWHRVIGLYAFVFIVWGMYRAVLFRMPVWIEEVVLKGLVFGLPVFWLAIRREGHALKDLGVTSKRIFESVYIGISLGVLLGVVGQVGNIVRHGSLTLASYQLHSEDVGIYIILALITAFWEGLLFFGYILLKLSRITHELRAAGITAVLYSFIHLPALLLIQNLGIGQVLLSAVLLGLLGFGSAILMLRYQNLAAPIMVQALWGVTVFLFR